MAHNFDITKHREKEIYQVTIIGSLLNFTLLLFKFMAGILGHSAAMVADAVHSLSDFITDIAVLVFVWISNKPKDEAHRYGHGKYETLATLIIGFVLVLTGVFIAYNGIRDMLKVAQGNILPSPGLIALWAAIVSILLKEALYRYTALKGKKLKSDAVIANAWHHRSDMFSSVATALGIGGAILLGAQWTILDPVVATLVSIFIVKLAFRLMRPAIDELMERSLPEEIEQEIKAIILSFDGVSGLHNFCTRKIGCNYAIECHVRMDGNATLAVTHGTITAIEAQLRNRYGQATHIIIHTEPLKTK